MKYKLIIFDLDGTLADTSPGILNGVRYTQKMMNLPTITLEKMYSHIGPPMDESYNRNFGLVGDSLKQAVDYHKEYAVNGGYKELNFYDGIISLLDDLRRAGIKLAVATLKSSDTAHKIFKCYELADKFDIVIGVNSDNPLTKTQLIQNCLKQLNISPKTAVLVGDSRYDAIGANEAEVDFIAVTYGFGFKSNSDVESYKYVSVCNSVAELRKFLLDT